MKLNKGLSAYPILCENDSDYADGYFLASFELANDQTRLTITMDLQEDAIAQCIADGSATYLVHVECPLTSYRKKYITGAEATMDLPLDELAGDVEVSTYIIATRDIKGFTSSHFNHVYEGCKLTYPKGTLLAIGPVDLLTITRSGSDAQTLPDIFHIYGDLEDKQTYWVNLTGDTIDIHVTPTIQNFYHTHPAQKRLLNEMLILPAAIEALTAVAIANDTGDTDTDYTGWTWYRIFDETLKRSKLSMDVLTMTGGQRENAIQVAHMLFRQPLGPAIETLAELVRRAED